MKHVGKMVALILALLTLIPVLVHNQDKNQSNTYSTIVVPNPPEVDQPTPVETIITQPDGTIIEKQYMYDPDSNSIQIDSAYNEENSSLFFPALELGFLFAGGYWVDHDGYYWNNDHWNYSNNDHWNDHWNNYWQNEWNNKNWRNHWQNRSGDKNWTRNHPQSWSHPGGRSPGMHREGGAMRGGRGGGRR